MPDDGTFEIVGTCLLDSDANMQLLIPWCNFLKICLVEIHGFKTVGIICMISYMESGMGVGANLHIQHVRFSLSSPSFGHPVHISFMSIVCFLQEAYEKSNNWLPPPWAILAMIVLGFNEFMLLLR